jgi:hypothetical protein
MGVTELVRAFAARRRATLGLSDLRRIEQRRDDRGRPDSDRDTCLHQLSPPFLIALFAVAHSILSSCLASRPYSQRQAMTISEWRSCAAA